MEITKEAFEHNFQQTLETLLSAMAEEPEISPQQFYSMACILENLAFFSPVLYSAPRKSENNS